MVIEMAISRRTERAMARLMCGVKSVDRKNNEHLMEMLGLEETLDKMAKVNGILWYGHMVRRDDDNVLKKSLMLEVNAGCRLSFFFLFFLGFFIFFHFFNQLSFFFN